MKQHSSIIQKCILGLLVLAIVLFPVLPFFADDAYGADAVGYSDGKVPYPSATAESGILVDAETGYVLWEKASNTPMFPASLTKIMTAILAFENLNMDQFIVIDSEVTDTFVSWHDIHLSTRDQITVEDALYALLLDSNNSIATAIAKTVSGDISSFAVLMNEKAAALGCKNTNFVNPHGLHDSNHVTTAYDMTLMLRYALTIPGFVKYAGTTSYAFPDTTKSTGHVCTNTNSLLTGASKKLFVNKHSRYAKYDGIVCGKTGSTPEAGSCLAAVADEELDGNRTRLIGIVLNSASDLDRYADMIGLFDWGFDNFRTIPVVSAGTAIGTASVKRGSVLTVDGIASKGQFATIGKRKAGDVTITPHFFDTLQAPVVAGEMIGSYEVWVDGERTGEYVIVAAKDVLKGGFLSNFGIDDARAYQIYRRSAIVLVILAVLSAVFAVFAFLQDGGRSRASFGSRRR